jgi:hypothetical protein
MEKLLLAPLQRPILYDRRFMLLLLKTQGYGRRSFSEGCRFSKMPSPIRIRRYEIPKNA